MKLGARTIQAQLLVKAPPSWCPPGSAHIWWLLPRSSLFQIWTTMLGSRRSLSDLLQQPIPPSLIRIWTQPLVWSLLSSWMLQLRTHPPSVWPRSDLILLRFGPSIWTPPIWSSTPPSAPLQIWFSPSSVGPRSFTEEILSGGAYRPPAMDLLQVWIKGIDFFHFYLLKFLCQLIPRSGKVLEAFFQEKYWNIRNIYFLFLVQLQKIKVSSNFKELTLPCYYLDEEVALLTATGYYLLCYLSPFSGFLKYLLNMAVMHSVFWFRFGFEKFMNREMVICLPADVYVPLWNSLSTTIQPFGLCFYYSVKILHFNDGFCLHDHSSDCLDSFGCIIIYGCPCIPIMSSYFRISVKSSCLSAWCLEWCDENFKWSLIHHKNFLSLRTRVVPSRFLDEYCATTHDAAYYYLYISYAYFGILLSIGIISGILCKIYAELLLLFYYAGTYCVREYDITLLSPSPASSMESSSIYYPSVDVFYYCGSFLLLSGLVSQVQRAPSRPSNLVL